ncbi:MAG: hydroxyethylthiazole kinase [Solirubrobacterales bacterium]
MNNELSKVLTSVRTRVPLVHAITNYVTINDCANILLAFGASPAMCEAYDEVFEFAGISSSLYINVGTLHKEQEQAAFLAAVSAKNSNVPLVLDPVACGAIPKKNTLISKILEFGKVDVIKGNIGEIKFLGGFSSNTRGVDSLDTGDDALDACMALARKHNCVVAATGEFDYISDGKRSAIVKNGTDMFTKITGAGCMLGALCAGTAGASDDKFLSTVAAIVSMNVAGEDACKKSKLPGSFKVNLMDSIYSLTEEQIVKEGKIEWI